MCGCVLRVWSRRLAVQLMCTLVVVCGANLQTSAVTTTRSTCKAVISRTTRTPPATKRAPLWPREHHVLPCATPPWLPLRLRRRLLMSLLLRRHRTQPQSPHRLARRLLAVCRPRNPTKGVWRLHRKSKLRKLMGQRWDSRLHELPQLMGPTTVPAKAPALERQSQRRPAGFHPLQGVWSLVVGRRPPAVVMRAAAMRILSLGLRVLQLRHRSGTSYHSPLRGCRGLA